MTESKSNAPRGDEAPTQTPLAIERLVEFADGYLGVESFVAAGAFHGVTDKELTIAEARKLVAAYQKSDATEKDEA